MQLFRARTGQTGDPRAWTRRNARRLLAATVCTAAVVAFAAGVAPGVGWALLAFGVALAAEAVVSQR